MSPTRPTSLHSAKRAFQTAERKILGALREMREAHNSLLQHTPEGTGAPARDRHAEILHDGEHQAIGSLDRDEANALIESETWDICADESRGTLRVLSPGSTHSERICAHSLTLRGWLWLAFQNIGGAVKHSEIASLFDLPERGRSHRIHQMRTRVGDALGPDLSNRIFGTGINRAYPVHREGWSLCWIRKGRDPSRSLLLPEDFRSRAAQLIGSGQDKSHNSVP